jgi:hypothetical protein
MNRRAIAQQLIYRVDNWNCMKLKSCTAKEIVTRLKRQHTEWEKNLFRLSI